MGMRHGGDFAGEVIFHPFAWEPVSQVCTLSDNHCVLHLGCAVFLYVHCILITKLSLKHVFKNVA